MSQPATADQVRQPRLAELVAAKLRERIVSGRLTDGDVLPKQEDLGAEFGVSKPTMREAIRVLESEGLIEVQQGRFGGAVVHVPKVENIAVTMALVLETNGVQLPDVGLALQAIEPACVRLCALRPDRLEAVVPRLEELHAAAPEAVTDDERVVALSREFHEALAALCGNASLTLCAGALERLWTAHEGSWAEQAAHGHGFPELRTRREALEEHARVIECIRAGDGDGAVAAALAHLTTSQTYALHRAGDPIVDVPLQRRMLSVPATQSTPTTPSMSTPNGSGVRP
jgi:GntR family transcriptional regulator, transcriptional repressor for pyruvate dehydrogenase complex